MINKQRYFTAAGTIAAAALTAHLMQKDANPYAASSPPPINAAAAAVVAPPVSSVAPPVQNQVTVVSPALAPRPAATPVDDAAAPVDLAALNTNPEPPRSSAPQRPETVGGADIPAPPRDLVMPAPLPGISDALPKRVAASEGTPIAPVTEQPEVSQFGLSCGPILSVSPVADGLVNLILTAPCKPEQRIGLQHGALQFTAQTDALGAYQITAPAFTSEANFTVTFEDGETVEAMVDVPGVGVLERVAIVAESTAGFQIHALEFGADYGDDGHIWLENPGNPALAATEGQGYLLQMGDPELQDAMLSQVYTFPRVGNAAASGVVRLSVETEITALNCSRDISGQTIERNPLGETLSMSIEVAVPDCDAIGEYLVLKNLLRDLRIASSN